jgi:arabinofuranosyltransferase
MSKPNPPDTRSTALLPWIGFGLMGLLFAWMWLDYRDLWLDDAFITFRYALHLAQGLGPIYNPGEWVEGYTTPLWMLLTAIPLAGFPAEQGGLAIIKLSGLALGVWILFRCFTFPRPEGQPARRWLVILLASNATFVANCGDGMETPLFMALTVEWARASVRVPTAGPGVAAGLLTAALVWTRPEALPLLVLLPALLLVAHSFEPGDKSGESAEPRARPALRAWMRGFALAGPLPVAAHLAWRWHYYGLPLPNSYYAKAGGALLPRLQSGLADLSLFAVEHGFALPVALWLAVALSLLGLWLAARSHPRSGRALTWHAVLWGLVVFRVSFDLWSGSEIMGAFRFLAPALPPLFILADEGARELAGRLRLGKLALALAVACLAVAIGFQIVGHYGRARARGAYQRGMERAHLPLGAWLAERYPGDAVVAIGDAGVVPFFSRLRVVDLWGLNDATIAQLPGEFGDRPGTASYALGRRPDAIVLWNLVPIHQGRQRGRIHGAQPFDRELAEHPDFQRDYRFVREFVFRPLRGELGGYYLDAFERR